MPSQKNIEEIKNLSDKINEAKSFILVDYRGLTVEQVTTLRREIKEAGGELKVAKNTLLKLALRKTVSKKEEVESLKEALTGPTMVLFSFNDPIAPLKVLTKFAKETELPKIKVGILENNFLPLEKIEELAKLPGRDELRAKLVGQLNAPIFGFVNVFQGSLRKLVYALNAIKETKN
jgi:large subunit ribosomal protein L10